MMAEQKNGEPGSSGKSLGHNTKPRNTNLQQVNSIANAYATIGKVFYNLQLKTCLLSALIIVAHIILPVTSYSPFAQRLKWYLG